MIIKQVGLMEFQCWYKVSGIVPMLLPNYYSIIEKLNECTLGREAKHKKLNNWK